MSYGARCYDPVLKKFVEVKPKENDTMAYGFAKPQSYKGKAMHNVLPGSSWFGTQYFEWEPKSRTFTTDLSLLDMGFCVYRHITIHNPKTNGEAHFTCVDEVHDREGDITHWVFETDEHGGMKIIVFND